MNQALDLRTNFTTLDWIIVVVYLLGSVAIGLYANRYIRDMTDYIVAGRSLRSFISIATMLGSEIGLVTVMYTAQKGFTGGLAAFHIGLAAGLVCLFVGLTGFIVVPLRELGVMTIPEFYEKRFSRGVRILGGTVLSVAGVLNMGVFLRAGAIFLTALTGMNDPNAVNIVMTVLIVLVLIYTILGGMVSVVITDYIQFVVLSFGMLGACLYALYNLGWNNIVETVGKIHAEAGFNPLNSEGFGPANVVWMFFVFGLISCAVWPTAVMRACAAESTQVVRRLYIWSSIGFMTRFIIPQFLGVCALVYMWHHAEAHEYFFTAAGDVVNNSDRTLEAMPVFLSQLLPAGVIGLIGASMLAAFMSTHDSYLLCWASVFVEDVVNPAMGQTLSTRTRLLLARISIFVIAVLLLVCSLWYPLLGQDMLDFLAVSGAIYFTGAFALLVLGLYWKRASSTGAYLALVTGVFAMLGLAPIKEQLGISVEDLGYDISAHIGLGTTVLSVLLMVVGSLLFPDKHSPSEA